MKELSIEQKAKAYDKALEAIKSLQEVNPSDEGIQNWINENFPELKESEDERIRKWLIHYFKEVCDNVSEKEKKGIVAWLEKQPKDSPVHSNSTNIGKVEQKPARCAWTERDEKQARQIERIVHDDGCTQKLQTQIADWLKSLKYRVQSQPKQEWSEEEIEKAAQEWDSKANFNPFYMTMDGDKPTGVKQDITTHKESFKAGVNWILKSLRPQNTWKPSDEQIEALEHFVRSIGESGYASPYDNNTKLLYSLLSDLKKLKE